MHQVTVTDENGNDFEGLTKHLNPAAEQKVAVWVFIDGENGFGRNVGEVCLLQLKKLGDGRFGA